MANTNPVFQSISQAERNPYGNPGNQYGGQYGNPYGQQMPAGYAPLSQAERPITVDDIVAKTGTTLGVIVAVAIAVYVAGLSNPGIASLASMLGMAGGFVTVLIATFGKKFSSKAVTLTYAAFEGLFVGGITYLFANVRVGGADAGSLIGQAVLGTVGVFMGMLWVYKTGAVKVTPRFTRIINAALVGVMVLALGNLVMWLFGFGNPLTNGGPLAIVFSLVCIGLAAMSFLQDFDSADRLVRAGAPAENAWGVALGLAVTLVWLYTEILRLLSYLNSRN